MKKDVLFIHPGNHKKTYQELSNEFSAIAPPTWTSLLANYVRKKSYSVDIYDVNINGIDGLHNKISESNPELIIIMVYGHHPSASTQTMPATRELIRNIKIYNKEIPIALGGIHPSALPQRTLYEECVDFVIKGEGAYTIYELLSYLKGKRHIRSVQGLWYWEYGIPKYTFDSILIKDLDNELDDYAWDLLPDFNLYRAHNMHCFQDFKNSKKNDFSDIKSPYIILNTSLGCPYNCNFCSINAIFGKPKIRYWSIERVILWIDVIVKKYKIKNIRIDDELFLLNNKRIERFCDLLIDRNYDLNFWVYGRTDTIKINLLKKMKKVGINWICLGIESGNKKVLKNVNKPIKKNIKSIVKKIQNNDIYVLGNYMFGLPEDNIKTMKETLYLAMDLNCEFSNFYTTMSYPGSKLHRISPYVSNDWNTYSQHGYYTEPLSTRYISNKEVLKFRDNAFNIYHNNPKYLKMIEKKFGNKVINHIKKMLDIKIKRKLLED